MENIEALDNVKKDIKDEESLEAIIPVKNYMLKTFWVFLICSLIGCIVETLGCLIQKGYFEYRQGLIYSPLIPVYGVGAVLYYILIDTLSIKRKVEAFFYCMILGGIVEYLFSYCQEIFFGTISWDYGKLLFNIDGRTSLLHCIYWGLAGILFLKLIYPYINNIDKYISRNKFKLATTLITLILILDITISCMAAVRQNERMNNTKAKNGVDVFLDEKYPDAIMDKIFSNRKIVNKSIK